MSDFVPLPPLQLFEDDPIQEAEDHLSWTQRFIVSLLTTPRPRWWVEIGLPDDLEDIARLHRENELIGTTRSKLLAMKKAASCQNAAAANEPTTTPAQP